MVVLTVSGCIFGRGGWFRGEGFCFKTCVLGGWGVCSLRAFRVDGLGVPVPLAGWPRVLVPWVPVPFLAPVPRPELEDGWIRDRSEETMVALDPGVSGPPSLPLTQSTLGMPDSTINVGLMTSFTSASSRVELVGILSRSSTFSGIHFAFTHSASAAS